MDALNWQREDFEQKEHEIALGLLLVLILASSFISEIIPQSHPRKKGEANEKRVGYKNIQNT